MIKSGKRATFWKGSNKCPHMLYVIPRISSMYPISEYVYKKVHKHFRLNIAHVYRQKNKPPKKSTTWCEPKFVKMNSICHLGLCTLCGFYHETKFAPLLWNRKLVLLFYFFFFLRRLFAWPLFFISLFLSIFWTILHYPYNTFHNFIALVVLYSSKIVDKLRSDVSEEGKLR